MKPQQIQIKLTDEELKGRFANSVNFLVQDDHVVFDFLMAAPPAGQLVSRIITSPSHAKQIIEVLSKLIEKHEKGSGKTSAAETTKDVKFGFNTE